MTSVDVSVLRERSVPSTWRGALHVVELSWLRFRRMWRTSFTTAFLQPLMYLLGMGLGVGTLVEKSGGDERVLGGVGYAAFLAPGLLVTTAMFVAANEATWPILAGFKWQPTFLAQSTAPIDPSSIVLGTLGWIAVRSLLASSAVALAMCVIPATRSTGLPVSVLVGVLTGLAFAAPTMAYSATKERDTGFVGYHRFLIVPVFLFGGAFYPISELPAALRPFAQLTPLWHGVELARAACLHEWRTGRAVGHAAYLLTWVAAGFLLSLRTFTRRLSR